MKNQWIVVWLTVMWFGARSASAQVPGTPLTISGSNPGGSIITLNEVVSGTTLIAGDYSGYFTNLTAEPGDLILLNDPNGGNNPTNWLAVVRFFNPADPTGINGLPATYSKASFATSLGGNGFAGLTLFPNTSFEPGTLGGSGNAETIIATSTQFGPAGVIDAGQTAITVLAVFLNSDLSLNASATPEPVTVGQNVTYSLTVSNGGEAAATGIVISNQIPAGVNFVSATGGSAPTNGVLLLNLGSLAVGATGTAQVVLQPTAAGHLTNVFQVSSDLLDPVLSNNTATVVSTVTNVMFAGPPGTPASGFQNPGGSVVVVGEGGGIGAQPIRSSASGINPYDAFAGDVVWLLNTNNGTATTNWQAVLRFINPADPTGTNGLAATEYETFFPSNSSPNDFADFTLLPNAIYVPVTGTNADGSITANAILFGPVGSIYSGQEAIILYKASLQPSSGADVSLSAHSAYLTNGTPGGGNLVYSVTVSNAGPAAATGVVVSNQIPANLAFVSATGGAPANNGIVLVPVGALAAGAAGSVQVVMRLPGIALGTIEITNTFRVFADQADPDPANNTATVVKTAGVPDLIIVPNGPDSVKILWLDTGPYTLVQNSNLAGGKWTTSGYSITTASDTNSITVTPPAGNLYFRLRNP